MREPFKAIHFDMDGVIADTEPLHVAAEQQTCKDFDFAINPNDWGGFKGQTAQSIFAHLMALYGDPAIHSIEQLIEHKTSLFIEHAKRDLMPIEGALDFLKWARQQYGTMTLVTSSNRTVQQHIINILDIGHYFDNVVTGDDVTTGKPHPEPYLKSLEQTNTQAHRSLVIEDSISGIQSALAAGCSVLAVATSHTVDVLAGARPTYIAKDYTEAKQILSAVA